jgi:hypothetical protein
MNCFNIREIQGILKRKFFTDLVNTSDNRLAMDSTLVGMRHKNNMSNILLYDQSLFYNFDLTNTSKFKTFNIPSNDVYTYSSNFFKNSSILKNVNINNNILNLPTQSLNQLLKDIVLFFYPGLVSSLSSFLNSIFYIKSVLVTTFYLPLNLHNSLLSTLPTKSLTINPIATQSTDSTYTSNSVSYSNYNSLNKFSFGDNSSS